MVRQGYIHIQKENDKGIQGIQIEFGVFSLWKYRQDFGLFLF